MGNDAGKWGLKRAATAIFATTVGLRLPLRDGLGRYGLPERRADGSARPDILSMSLLKDAAVRSIQPAARTMHYPLDFSCKAIGERYAGEHRVQTACREPAHGLRLNVPGLKTVASQFGDEPSKVPLAMQLRRAGDESIGGGRAHSSVLRGASSPRCRKNGTRVLPLGIGRSASTIHFRLRPSETTAHELRRALSVIAQAR